MATDNPTTIADQRHAETCEHLARIGTGSRRSTICRAGSPCRTRTPTPSARACLKFWSLRCPRRGAGKAATDERRAIPRAARIRPPRRPGPLGPPRRLGAPGDRPAQQRPCRQLSRSLGQRRRHRLRQPRRRFRRAAREQQGRHDIERRPRSPARSARRAAPQAAELVAALREMQDQDKPAAAQAEIHQGRRARPAGPARQDRDLLGQRLTGFGLRCRGDRLARLFPASPDQIGPRRQADARARRTDHSRAGTRAGAGSTSPRSPWARDPVRRAESRPAGGAGPPRRRDRRRAVARLCRDRPARPSAEIGRRPMRRGSTARRAAARPAQARRSDRRPDPGDASGADRERWRQHREQVPCRASRPSCPGARARAIGKAGANFPDCHNVAKGAVKANREHGRERELSDAELRRLLAYLDASPDPEARAVELLLGDRGAKGRAAGLRWSDISGGWWTIPALRQQDQAAGAETSERGGARRPGQDRRDRSLSGRVIGCSPGLGKLVGALVATGEGVARPRGFARSRFSACRGEPRDQCWRGPRRESASSWAMVWTRRHDRALFAPSRRRACRASEAVSERLRMLREIEPAGRA